MSLEILAGCFQVCQGIDASDRCQLKASFTLLHISFPGRQTAKATDFIFFYQKTNNIFVSVIYSLSIIVKREWAKLHRKHTKLLA